MRRRGTRGSGSLRLPAECPRQSTSATGSGSRPTSPPRSVLPPRSVRAQPKRDGGLGASVALPELTLPAPPTALPAGPRVVGPTPLPRNVYRSTRASSSERNFGRGPFAGGSFFFIGCTYLRRNSRRSPSSMSRAAITRIPPPGKRRKTTKARRPVELVWGELVLRDMEDVGHRPTRTPRGPHRRW